MISRKVTVSNSTGLHVRPAGTLVKAAEQCSSRVEIIYKYNIINAKSLLNILSASIAQGEEIELRCNGPEEAEDMEKMLEVLANMQD